MRKLCLYIAMSLDGYVADSEGGVAFLQGHDETSDEMGTYEEFIATVDTVLLGYKTYRQIEEELSPDVWPYQGMHSYVFTHQKMQNKDDITFTGEDPCTLVQTLRRQPGKDIWLCGGAMLAQTLLDEIDTYRISVIPCILGKGVPLFATRDIPKNLRLTAVSSANGIAELCYERRNG